MKPFHLLSTIILFLITLPACQTDEEIFEPEGSQTVLKAAAVNILNYDNFYDHMSFNFTSQPYCPDIPGDWTLGAWSEGGRWGKLSWNWTACPLSPLMVNTADGNLLLKVPGNRIKQGGQIESVRTDYGFGSYRAMIRAGSHSGEPTEGTCRAFFFYNSATTQEIDVEILTRESNLVHFVTHPGDYHIVYDLGKDPAGTLIEYGFDWYKNKVDFFVDGNKVGTQTRAVPGVRGKIILNHWTGTAGWSGTPPPYESVMLTDYVWHVPFLLVAAPDASGLVFKRGTNCQITWNSYGDIITGKVTLEIWKGGKLYKTIASRINNTGSYSFTIPTSYPVAGNYRIKIKSLVSADYYDFSNADFAINRFR